MFQLRFVHLSIGFIMRFKVLVITFIFLCSIGNFGHALSVKSKTFDQLVLESDEVIQGRVVAMESRFGEGPLSRYIFTYIEFNQLQVVKGTGEVDAERYQLRIAGGRVGDLIQAFPGAPQFQLGQDYVLFVRGNGREMFPLVGVHQGVYEIAGAEENDRMVQTHDNPILRSVVAFRASQGLNHKSSNTVSESQSQSRGVDAVDHNSLQADEFMSLIRLRWQQLQAVSQEGER